MAAPEPLPYTLEHHYANKWTLALWHSILSVKGVGGVKIKDTVLVTEKGRESLNRFPHVE